MVFTLTHIQVYNMANRLFVTLTAPERSMLGWIIGIMYYGRFVRNKAFTEELNTLFEMAPGQSGFPHNGGGHSFSIKGTEEEVLSWLDLLKEVVPEVESEVNAIREHQSRGKASIYLRLINRTVNNVRAPWYGSKEAHEFESARHMAFIKGNNK